MLANFVPLPTTNLNAHQRAKTLHTHEAASDFFDALSRRVFYGWVILPVTAITMFGTGPSQSHLIGLFFKPLSRDL